MAYRMLVVDLDGTALNTRDELAGEVAAALRRAQAAGMLVVLATGRGYRTALPVLREAALDSPAVCLNGALTKHPQDHRTLEAMCLDEPTVRQVVEVLHAAGESPCLHIDGYTSEIDMVLVPGPRVHPDTQRFCDIIGERHRVVRAADVAGVPATECLQVSVVADAAALERCRAAVEAAFDSRVQTLVIAAPNFRMQFFEVFAPGVNKWAAVRRLAGHRGIDPNEIVAVGDDVNDLVMVREAGLGIAMGNAAPAVRAAADRVGPSCDDGGVARIVDELLG